MKVMKPKQGGSQPQGRTGTVIAGERQARPAGDIGLALLPMQFTVQLMGHFFHSAAT